MKKKKFKSCLRKLLKTFLSFVVNWVLVAWEGNDEAVGELKRLTQTCIPNMLSPK